MRVLVSAVSRFTSPTGICRHAANLVRALESQQAVENVVLAIGAWQREYFHELLPRQDGKITWEFVKIRNNSLHRNSWFAFGLPAVARNCGADVVHVTFPVPVIRGRFRAPVVATVHDLYPYDIPENFGYPRVLLNRAFLTQCVHASDRLACVSQSTLERLRYYYPEAEKKAVVVHNVVGVLSAESEPLSAARHPFLLTVAQHRKNKNIDVILRAFGLIRARSEFSGLSLLLVGAHGPESNRLARVIRELGLEGYVRFFESVRDGELRWLYENAAAVVTASSIEGFGLPVLEALAAGRPVICSDIAAFREIGNESCHYFDLGPGVEERLADRIVMVLNTKKAKTAEFRPADIRSTGAAYLNLYAAVLPDFTSIVESPNQIVTM